MASLYNVTIIYMCLLSENMVIAVYDFEGQADELSFQVHTYRSNAS